MILPLGSTRPPPPRTTLPSDRRSRDAISLTIVTLVVKLTFLLLMGGSSYLAGSILGQYSLDDMDSIHGESMSVGRLVHGESMRAKDSDGTSATGAVDCKKAEEEFIEMHVREELEKHRKAGDSSNNSAAKQTKRFPEKTNSKFLSGIARVKKDILAETFDFGNPMERGKGTGEEDALIWYQGDAALPSTFAAYDDGNGIPLFDPETATKNCDSMNVIFTENPGNVRQCTAIISNFESYHVQRWMRVDTTKSTPVKSELPLAPVSRGYASRGKANFYAPPSDGKFSPVRKHWKMLGTFLHNVDSVLDDLKPILKKVAKNNAVIILTCNKGQSALLMNFACSARSRGFDLGNILVFPSDIETRDLAEGLGLATYYDEKNMSPLPSGEARRYGDKNFRAMMYAKVLCVLYPLMLGYDVLFQDVDIVWMRDPMEFFHDEKSKVADFDVIFQHDGSYSVRYAPYTANSGFYYVRANKRSQYLFTSMLYHSDLIITWDSHQQLLVQLLAEHSSLFGLNVKVLGRDTEMFPGGYHFHRRRDFMKKLVKGETDSYIFHMSWTENKDNKLLFLRQLGEWYLKDECIGKTAAEILGSPSSEKSALVQPCCATEFIFSCHYKDKPSKLPCKSSDPIDKHGGSFW